AFVIERGVGAEQGQPKTALPLDRAVADTGIATQPAEKRHNMPAKQRRLRLGSAQRRVGEECAGNDEWKQGADAKVGHQRTPVRGQGGKATEWRPISGGWAAGPRSGSADSLKGTRF